MLVDTSVWVDHLRSGDATLAKLWVTVPSCLIPGVTGELGLGNLSGREEVGGLLRGLPQAVVAENSEVLRLVEREGLYGVGWTISHLPEGQPIEAATCRNAIAYPSTP